MKVLELFKGTGSITNFYKNNKSVEVISLDILKKYNPTICCDIMDWDYKTYPVGYFDIIFAGPECKVFSSLQNANCIAHNKTAEDYKKKMTYKSIEELNKVRQDNSIYINKTIEIIEYFKPKKYFIENPQYSKIWDYVENKKYLDKYFLTTYCYWGTTPYKKPTKFLTNIDYEHKCCKCEKHNIHLGISSKKKMEQKKVGYDNSRLKDRYEYPYEMLKYLLN